MSKVLKAILISAYSVVIFKFISSLMERNDEEITINYILPSSYSVKKLNRQMKKHKKNLTAFTPIFKKPERLSTDFKYILKYTDMFGYTSPVFRSGQMAFLQNNCTFNNCYFSSNKVLFADIRFFDAIIFDVENSWDYHPMLRSPHQKYIFSAIEAPDKYPICHPDLDKYYNLTWTYRLDSDIQQTFFKVLDKDGRVVGPKINMSWKESTLLPSEEIRKKISNKNKISAWFVPNCYTKNRLENITKPLQDALAKYDLQIDIYGWCANLTCSKYRIEDCLELLEENYYFYLAYESSIAEDYVTDEILYPLQHYTVPIVYGGANYSRFLPPGSYINARELDSNAVASLMLEAMNNKDVYQRYFRWRNHYEYRGAADQMDACDLCKILNLSQKETVIDNFRAWWDKGYKKSCEAHNLEKVITF